MKLLFHFITVIVGKDVTVPFYISAGMGLHMPLVFNISHFVYQGVFSSLVSRYTGLIRRDYTPSRGAVSYVVLVLRSSQCLPQSGAIMGIMTMVVTKWPDLTLVLVFFPFVSIPALWVKWYWYIELYDS